MAMYRFFQKEEDGPWFPVQESDQVLEDAKRQGAKKLTILSVDAPQGADDVKRGHKYRGPLYFDIDHDSGDVNESILSAQNLVTKLIEVYEVPEEAIQVFCSGKKGLHVLVEQRAFMPRETAVKDLPLIYKAMAAELYVMGLDMSPYACGRGNTFRIANLKRYDGNYRVPIRVSELFKLTPDSYREYVSRPREGLTHAKYKGNYSIRLNVLFASATEQVTRWDRELTERSRNIAQGMLEKVADRAPPCVEAIAEYKTLKDTTTFNQVALNLALWASRAGAPELERQRIFEMTADNAPRSDRYPTPRSRITELQGKYQFTINSADYKFGCGAMRSMLKEGRKICAGCPLENNCRTGTAAEFLSDVAEQAGIAKTEAGYRKIMAKGKSEQISTFVLEPDAAFMEELPDGTGMRRRGTLCRVMRNGEQLHTVVMDESCWASKSAFLKALEGVPGVYYIGGDAEIQKIKMLVFLEEEKMPEIYQVHAAGMYVERRREGGREAEIFTYVEPGRSLNNLHMTETHRLTKSIPLPPTLFQQVPIEVADLQADQALANLCRANQAPIMALTLGWFVACHLKAHLRECYGQFPLLALWGGSGAGKSAIAGLLATLHGMNCTQRSTANMSAINRFNAIELLSGTTTVPRLCEEYNKDKMPEHQYTMLGELFKALWGCESAQRGAVVAGQRSAVSIEIPLTAPACITSEQQIKMPALLERTLVIRLAKGGRNRDAFMKARAGRVSLMRLGQHLMQQALNTPLRKVERMLEDQEDYVSADEFEDRPRYSLMVVHMALEWLATICTSLRMADSVTEIHRLKAALTLITRPNQSKEEKSDSLSGILGQARITEIDQLLLHLVDLAAESGAILKEEAQTQQRALRRVWISPRTDYMVAGDLLYLDGKTCHSRYLEWCRAIGLRTPLMAWSDVKQLIEHEPYFAGWKSLEGFAFGQPALALSIGGLANRNIDVTAMRRIYDVFGTVGFDT